MFITKHIQSFEQYILSEEAKHIEDIEIDDESDNEHDKELKDGEDKDIDHCARCGEENVDCSCEDDDAWSTQTFHRVPKGEEGSMEPKQKFKKE